MLKALPFQMGHLDFFECKDPLPTMREDLLSISMKEENCVASLVNPKTNRVVAIVGLNHIRKGVSEAWVLISEEAYSVKISFHKSILKILDQFEAGIPLHRVQLTVAENFSVGQAWARSLGFECEGLMKKFDIEGGNHFLFARVK